MYYRNSNGEVEEIKEGFTTSLKIEKNITVPSWLVVVEIVIKIAIIILLIYLLKNCKINIKC